MELLNIFWKFSAYTINVSDICVFERDTCMQVHNSDRSVSVVIDTASTIPPTLVHLRALEMQPSRVVDSTQTT